jgi:hypothetical protein
VATIQGFLFFLTKEIYIVGDKERDEGEDISLSQKAEYIVENLIHISLSSTI